MRLTLIHQPLNNDLNQCIVSKDSESDRRACSGVCGAAAVNERYMRNGFFIGFNRTDCFSTEIMRHLQYPFGSKYGPLFFSILSDAGTKKVIQSIIQDTIYTLSWVTSWEIRGLLLIGITTNGPTHHRRCTTHSSIDTASPAHK
jgi:hypothetical protein